MIVYKVYCFESTVGYFGLLIAGEFYRLNMGMVRK